MNPLASAGLQLTTLIVAAEVTSEIGGLLGDIAPELTVVGAVGVSVRFLHKAYKDGLSVYQGASEAANKTLADERAQWALEKQAYAARIASLEAQFMIRGNPQE